MSDKDIESEILAKGLTAPRVTPSRIESTIASEHYFTAAQGDHQSKEDDLLINPEPYVEATPNALHLLTFCVLVLRNGFTVTGESACASPENFDPEIGRKIARENAVNKIWMLEGYLLKQKLSEQ
ncbi:Gp49 family protein [Klebsiella pneumoniae]|uniref:Gp49 family protein n=1 Tax=Klebsiella pneumoniae TaxID=573 RepID=UPI0014958447|nr:Gp49 family protein [Klebsiella pneumoniae]